MNDQMNEFCLGLGVLTRVLIFEVSPKEGLRTVSRNLSGGGNSTDRDWHEPGWRFGRVGCAKETAASCAAGAEIEYAGRASDGWRNGTRDNDCWALGSLTLPSIQQGRT